MSPSTTKPCAFAHIAGTRIRILPLSPSVLSSDKSILTYVTHSMNWPTPGIPVLLYPCDYPNNFLSLPPAKIHCFIQPHCVAAFFHLLESNSTLEFVTDHSEIARDLPENNARSDTMDDAGSSSGSADAAAAAAETAAATAAHANMSIGRLVS
ncbi:hypothetical protein GGF40_002004 [Coemansia sp. RSA 1286]|nr:hypothetical protein IWW45_002484 [Coemansia sp. RSA 485]KAJ2599903.1 hypothetical protein GGF39_002033 [Coemansia sp. RSA 1721]KAJ2637954.1 hypothetical protein GGF40_002004 [Coemansia sp. RSA 1286]